MQKDFHYYAIKVLAETAGFSPEEAQILAYSSQYVDEVTDCTLTVRHIREQYPDFLRDVETNTYLCTAYKSTNPNTCCEIEMQKNVLLPFHLLPEVIEQGINYITKPDAKLGRELVEIAITELHNTGGEIRTQKLIKLGIALHAFADSWAHQGFAGYCVTNENEISENEILYKNVWEKLSPFLQKEFGIIEDFAHPTAFNMPDISHLKWRYIKNSNQNSIIRDNTVIFMQAAFKIFELLKTVTGKNVDWEEDDYKFLQCYNQKFCDINTKCDYYKKKFPHTEFFYDSQQWTNEARRDENKKLLYFFTEAFLQRKYVTNKITLYTC